MSDIFHEVEEDLRRERLKKLWDRYGIFVIGAAVAIVLATAGQRGWVYWQATRAAASGDRFVAAVDLADTGDFASAETALNTVIAEGSGDYPVLARFRLASARAEAGEVAAAIIDFDRLAADGAVGEELQSLARLRAATLLVDSGSRDEVAERIEALAAGGSTWRNAAAEIMGLAAWKADDFAEAGKWYGQILGDPNSPAAMRRRADLALSVIAAAGGPPKPAASGLPLPTGAGLN